MRFAAVLLSTCALAAAAPPKRAELVDVRKIWDQAPHNAFTDLIRFKGRWYCAFREGSAHVSPDGAVRLLSSADGMVWQSAALLKSPLGDLRDPKLSVTPDGRLMLLAAAALPQPGPVRHQSLAWFSPDGRFWGDAIEVADPNFWLWRVTWQNGRAYGVAYSTRDRQLVRLYTSRDGLRYTVLVDDLYNAGFPNESALLFLPDDSGLCLLRRDAPGANALIGRAPPPYHGWSWKDLGVRLGGPDLIRLADGRLAAGGRRYDGKVRTSLGWLDPDAGTLTEFLALPSGGDNGYPGLVFHDGLLWVSYYSSHEGGKASIYLAQVKLP